MSGPTRHDPTTPGSPACLQPTPDDAGDGGARLEDVEQSIPSQFERQVARHGERIAVKTVSEALTYGELNRRANRIANHLLATRGQAVEPIAILMRKDAPAIASMLGVLKSGRFFVVLDARYPRRRLEQILEDCRSAVILCDDANRSLGASLARRGAALVDVECAQAAPDARDPRLPLGPDHLECIIYTSGSTGAPKGVSQTHRMELHQWFRLSSALKLHPRDRKTLFGSLAMGQAMTDVFMTLMSGAAIYPWDVHEQGLTGVTRWMRDEGITVYRSTASLFRAWCDQLDGNERFPRLRIVKVGSEPVAASDFERFRRHFEPGCLFVNALSSSEARTVRLLVLDHSSRVDGNIVPVGYPVDGVSITLRDEAGREVAAGEVGEIVVRSRYLSPGYWRSPEETRARFEPGSGGERVLRSGDLGRMTPDGCLTHLGRRDDQVHIRGYRIELAEIEMCLLGHPQVRAAAVIERVAASGDRNLAAFVVRATGRAPTADALRRHLETRLPQHFVPAFITFLDALPRTDNGKLDRSALPQLEHVRPHLDTPFVAPRTAYESRLAAIWTDVLEIDRIGVDDDFMALGGDSLLATRLVHRVIQEFEVDIPLQRLIEGSTIAKMAALLLEHQAREVDPQEMSRLLDELADDARSRRRGAGRDTDRSS